MKVLSCIKKFLKRIFIDYNEIKRISDNNAKEVEIAINKINSDINKRIEENIEIKLNTIIGHQNKLENEIINIQNQNNYVTDDIQNIKNQFLYHNIELTNIKKDEKCKNIIIIGFYGAPNLGDELMLETLLEYMEKIPNIKITVLLADNPEYSIDKYKDIRFIHYPKTLYDFNLIAEQYDYIIFGGGAIIDDKQYNKENSYKYDLGTILIKMALRAIAFNKKVICIALSASINISNAEYLSKLKYIIKNSYYFSVRDIYTKENLVEKLGKEVENDIININDIVLSNKNIIGNIVKENNNKRIENIGIVWIANDNNEEKLRKIIDNIQESNIEKYNINLIPFYNYKQIDTNFYNHIKEKYYNKVSINIEKYSENMVQAIELFKKNDIIIGMRYHSILIANALNIPCIPICYDIHEHYPYKIKYLNKMFKQKEVLSYINIENYDIVNKLKNINESYNLLNYENSKQIVETSQQEMKEIVDKIFNSN